MSKPILVAICGKSASGKTALRNWLVGPGFHYRAVVSDTTRPKRQCEKDGMDYNFIPEIDFVEKWDNNEYLEVSLFCDNFYGTPKDEIKSDFINVGIFNPEGMEELLKYQNEFTIIPVYIQAPSWIRLQRSYDRIGQFHFEFLRRWWADLIDFSQIKNTLNSFRIKPIVLNGKDFIIKNSDKVNQVIKSYWAD